MMHDWIKVFPRPASHVEKTAVVLYRRDNGVNLVNSEFEIELADIGPNHIGQSGDKFQYRRLQCFIHIHNIEKIQGFVTPRF